MIRAEKMQQVVQQESRSRFVMKSRRKSEHLRNLLRIKMNEKTIVDNFFFRLDSFLSHCFYSMFSKEFRNRCILKSLINISTYFC